jgi:hypothetical protein
MNRPRARVALIVAGAFALVLLPAVAASAATLLTVTPDTGVSGGQGVTIVASGLVPGATAGWCEGVPTAAADTGSCGTNTTFTQTVDATGTISGVFRLQRFIFVPNLAQWVDCTNTTNTCDMFAADAADIAGTVAAVPLLFAAPPDPPASRGTIQLTATGGALVVTGAGFRPGAAIDVHQCVTGVDHPSGCGFAKATPTADANGGFAVTVAADSFVVPAGGARVDCTPLETQACSIVAAEAVDFPGTNLGVPLPVPTGPPPVPSVVPGVVSKAEGNSGTTVFDVPVALSQPTTRTVAAQWNTLQVPGDRPDQADPATDYTPATGTITFAPGQTAATVPIVVNGDTQVEPDEYIAVSFHDPTNAVMGGYWGLGVAFITNDDHAKVVPLAGSVVEGNTGTSLLEVPVTLSNSSTQTVTAQYNTLQVPGDRPDQADPTTDYIPTSGTVTFAPGETAKTVPITVIGDTVVEPDEYVVVTFHDATNATIGGYWGLGIGYITNDD